MRRSILELERRQEKEAMVRQAHIERVGFAPVEPQPESELLIEAIKARELGPQANPRSALQMAEQAMREQDSAAAIQKAEAKKRHRQAREEDERPTTPQRHGPRGKEHHNRHLLQVAKTVPQKQRVLAAALAPSSKGGVPRDVAAVNASYHDDDTGTHTTPTTAEPESSAPRDTRTDTQDSAFDLPTDTAPQQDTQDSQAGLPEEGSSSHTQPRQESKSQQDTGTEQKPSKKSRTRTDTVEAAERAYQRKPECLPTRSKQLAQSILGTGRTACNAGNGCPPTRQKETLDTSVSDIKKQVEALHAASQGNFRMFPRTGQLRFQRFQPVDLILYNPQNPTSTTGPRLRVDFMSHFNPGTREEAYCTVYLCENDTGATDWLARYRQPDAMWPWSPFMQVVFVSRDDAEKAAAQESQEVLFPASYMKGMNCVPIVGIRV